MQKHQVRTPEQALAYLVDCTLATVSGMALLKSRKKSEFERQIAIAQQGIDWMKEMKIDPATSRAEEIINQGTTVTQWAERYMPEKSLHGRGK